MTDADVFNYALNPDYLAAQFQVRAFSDVGLPANELTGLGTQDDDRDSGTAAIANPGTDRRGRDIRPYGTAGPEYRVPDRIAASGRHLFPSGVITVASNNDASFSAS